MARGLAPRGVAVKVSGARELQRDLRRAGVDAKDLRGANRDIARWFAPTAAERAPYRTGRLSESVKGLGTATKAVITAGSAKVPYAGPIHFGWPTRPDPTRGWRGGPIVPQPFIYQALDERRDEVLDTYQAYMDQLCRRVDP